MMVFKFGNCTPGVFCEKASDIAFYTSRTSLICQIFVISILIFSCLVGNALLCYTVYKTSSKMSASSVFIINLAVTDILVGTLVLPFWILSTASLSWPLPHGVCQFTAFLTVTLMQCSIFSLSGISVDRYFNISHPLRYPIEATTTRVSAVVAGIWTFCILVASLPVIGWGEYRFQPQTVPICNPEYISQVSFSIFFVLFGMTLPFGIMLFCYIRIVQIARDHIKKIDALQRTLVNPSGQPQQFLRPDNQSEGGSSRTPSSENKPSLSTKFSKNVKAVRRVFIAVGVFFLCWGPYVIMNFWSVNNEEEPVPYLADLFTTLMAFANSSVNPVIFIVLNKDLRNVVCKLGRRLCCCSRDTTRVEHSDLITYAVDKNEGNVNRNKLNVQKLEYLEASSENNNLTVRDIKSEVKCGSRIQNRQGVREENSSHEPNLPGTV